MAHVDDAELFLVLADAGSFASAARQLDVSRSTVMRRVQALEERLGVTLVQVADRRLTLTHAGRLYAERLRPLLGSLRAVHDELAQLGGRPQGELRLWLPTLGLSGTLAPMFAAFRKAHPQVTLDIDMGRDVRRLELAAFDVSLQVGLRINKGLMARNLVHEEMMLVATPDYLDRLGTPQSLEELAEHEAVLLRDMEGRVVPWRGSDGRRVPQPPAVVKVNSMGLSYQLALRGAGLTLVGRTFAAPYLEGGELVQVLEGLVGVREPINLVFLPDPSPKVRAFVDFVSAWSATRFGGASAALGER